MFASTPPRHRPRTTHGDVKAAFRRLTHALGRVPATSPFEVGPGIWHLSPDRHAGGYRVCEFHAAGPTYPLGEHGLETRPMYDALTLALRAVELAQAAAPPAEAGAYETHHGLYCASCAHATGWTEHFLIVAGTTPCRCCGHRADGLDESGNCVGEASGFP